jgi:hypothetical protein
MKTTLYIMVIFMAVIALTVVSCNKDDNSENHTDPWSLVLEETIGPEGGTIGDESFSLEIPAGVFNSANTLSLYSSSNKVFGDNQVSPSFEIRGLPEEFEGTLPISIKSDRPVVDEFFLVAGTISTVRSSDDTAYAMRYLSAVDSSGYIQSSIKAVMSGRGVQPAQEFREFYKGQLYISTVDNQGTCKSTNGMFFVTYSKPEVSFADATTLAEGLATAVNKFGEQKFDTAQLRGSYPIPVTFRPFKDYLLGYLGDNIKLYGVYSTSAWRLSPSFEFNSDKLLVGENLIAPIAGHECFHMIQSLYHTNGELKNWLTEATATYVEEWFYIGTNYVPAEFSSHWYRPLTGMEDGATFYDPAEKKVSSAFHGYGMAAIIKYFITNAKVQYPLKTMIEAIHNDIHPVDAVFSVVPGEDLSSFWQMAMLNYVSKTTYPQQLLHRAFVTGDLYSSLNWAKSVTLSANQTDFPSATFNLPDLSATFVTISLDGDFSPEKEVFLNVTTIGEPEDINLYTWYYIYKSQGETPLLNAPATGTTKLQSLKDNKYSILVMITNSRHVNPYTEKTHVTLDIRIKGPIAATTNASNVTATTATLNGLINPNGEVTSGTFEYGLTTSYGSTVQIAQNQLNGIEKVPVTAELSGLQPEKMYYFRLTASNQSGVSTGEVRSFKTLKENTGPPSATTKAATNVTAYTATINGTINPNGTESYGMFEYGLTTAYGNAGTVSSNPLNGNQPIDISSDLTGLISGETYHFRLWGYHYGLTDISYGADMTFTTVAGGLQLGQEYQGGIIFYVEPNGLHGLIAALSDQGIAEWGCYQTAISGADGMDIGTGAQNTVDIVAGCPTAGIAAALCDDLELNGYNDWFLPSSSELYKLLIEAEYGGYLSGFAENYYWSSTEFSADQAYIMEFGGLTYGQMYKSEAYYVRAIRAF